MKFRIVYNIQHIANNGPINVTTLQHSRNVHQYSVISTTCTVCWVSLQNRMVEVIECIGKK